MFERVTASRFVLGLIGLGLIGLALIGCGGTGGGLSAPKVATGAVTLPAGFKLPMSQLAVSTPSGQVPVKPTGTFSAPVGESGVTMVQLVDTVSNKIVLLGYLDSASSGSSYSGGHGQISAATTATALLFMGLYGPEVPTANWDDYQNSIASSSEMTQVAAAVTTSVAANPTAISDGDTAIESAVNAIQASGVASSPVMVRGSPGNSVARVVVTRSSRGGGGSGTTVTSVDVTPGSAQSGIIVAPNPEGNGIVFVNNYRRRAVAYVYEVGKGQTANTVQPLSAPIEFASAEAIEPEEALEGVVATVYNGLHGVFAYNPTTTGPIDLTIDQGAPVTVYEVVVVGPGSTNNLTSVAQAVWPSNTGEQDILVAEWKKNLPLTVARSVAEDIILPIFIHMVESHKSASVFRTNEALDAGTEKLMESLSDVSDAISAGNLKLASTSFLNDILTQRGVQEAFGNLILTNTINSGVNSEALEKDLERLESANTAIEIINTSFLSADLSRLFIDAIASNLAESYKATVVPANVKLNPIQGVVNATDNIVMFTAQVQNATDLSKFQFKWSTTGKMGSLEEPINSVAMPTGLTSFSSADYVANLQELKNGISDTVTVTVYDETGQEVGTASSTVTAQEGQENETPTVQSGINFPSPGLGNGTVWTEADVVSIPLIQGATSYLIEYVQNGIVVGRLNFNPATGIVTTGGLNGPVPYLPILLTQGTLQIAFDGADEAELNSAEQAIQETNMVKDIQGMVVEVFYQ